MCVTEMGVTELSVTELSVEELSVQELSVKERNDQMKYTWKVIHQVVGKLEVALNAMQKDGFQVYSILPAGETGTALEMGATFAVVGRKEVDALTPV